MLSVVGEEAYHARGDEDDIYANLFGDRLGYLWDKQNRLENRVTGGERSVSEWRSDVWNQAHLVEQSRDIAMADPLSLEFRQFEMREASALDQARYKLSNDDSLSEARRRQEIINLEAKACAAVRCSEGVPDNDKYKKLLVGLQTYGERLSEENGGIRDSLASLGIDTTYRWYHGRSSGTATLFSYGWPDDQITDAASRDTDQLVQTVNNKFNAGWQTGAAIAVADIAAITGSEELDGFTHEMFSRAEQAWQLEYQSVVGQRVLSSMSADSFEEAPLYVLGAGGLAMEAVPLLGAGKKFGTVIDKTSDAFDGFVDAVRVIKRQERAADKADSLKSALSGFSARHFGHVDDSEILYTGLGEGEDLLRMPWEKTRDVLDNVGFGFGRYDGNGYGWTLENTFSPNSIDPSAVRRAYLNEKFGRTGNLNTDINVRGYLDDVERLDVSSGYGDAIFYSGPGNRARAEAFSNSGGITLESTLGGAWLDNQVLFKRLDPEQAIVPWERLSQRYAQEASGPVNVFIDGANPRGVFNRIELPAIYENPNIPLIIKNGVKPIRIK